MKILFLDLETSPNLVHCWGLWNQNVGINQIIEPSKTLCWAAKWYDEDVIMFDSIKTSSQRRMLTKIFNLINQADVIVHYNGKSFDMPVLNRDFVLHDMTPPQPAQEIDLLFVVKKRFKFASNKLAYVVKALGLGEKIPHEGHELWVKCMNGDSEAWERMEEYNKNDVILLERLYDKVKGWIPKHPNHGLYVESPDMVCRNCGGRHLISRGFRRTNTRIYKRYQCRDCGAWSSSRFSEKRDEDQNVLG